MIEDIGRAQVSPGCEVMVAVAVSVLFMVPDLYSAPYLPIGVSILAVAGLLICSTLGLRTGLQFWTLPVFLSTTVLLVLILIWSTNGSQAAFVDAWTTTLAVVRLCLVTSVLVSILAVTPIGRKRLGASLSTVACGTAIVLCLAIAPLGVEPVEWVFWIPAILGAISVVITTALLARGRHALQI